MTYLKLPRARVILMCFLIASAVLLRFPAIDIYIAGMFFDGRFYMQGQWWEQALHHGVGLFLCASTAVVLAVYGFNRIASARLCGIDGPKVLYVLLVLALGAGLLVNTTLKDNFGPCAAQGRAAVRRTETVHARFRHGRSMREKLLIFFGRRRRRILFTVFGNGVRPEAGSVRCRSRVWRRRLDRAHGRGRALLFGCCGLVFRDADHR